MIKENLKNIIGDKQIYCYGAGTYGKIVGYALLDMKIHFRGYLVSNKDVKLRTVLGKPVWELDKINISESDFILITVNEMLQSELENELKKRNDNIIIFIVTSYSEYLDEAMRFHVFRYLSKPLDKQRFFRNMKDAVDLYNTMTIKIPIETKQGVHTLPASSVIAGTGKKSSDTYNSA